MRRTIFVTTLTLGIFGTAAGLLAQDDQEVEAAAEPAEAAAEGGEGSAESELAEEAPEEEASGEDGHYAAIEAFLNGTNATNLVQKIDAFYAKDARYEDPFGALDGRIKLEERLSRWFGDLDSVAFTLKEIFASGDETVALWTMELKHKKIGDGTAVTVDGASQFRFAGDQVVYQRNYFDAGALVYEHVTFVGWLVRWVKGKVAGV